MTKLFLFDDTSLLAENVAKNVCTLCIVHVSQLIFV